MEIAPTMLMQSDELACEALLSFNWIRSGIDDNGLFCIFGFRPVARDLLCDKV